MSSRIQKKKKNFLTYLSGDPGAALLSEHAKKIGADRAASDKKLVMKKPQLKLNNNAKELQKRSMEQSAALNNQTAEDWEKWLESTYMQVIEARKKNRWSSEVRICVSYGTMAWSTVVEFDKPKAKQKTCERRFRNVFEIRRVCLMLPLYKPKKGVCVTYVV